MAGEEDVKVIDEPSVAGPVAGTPVLVCFPSAGLASTIVGHYLIRSRSLPRCNSITSADMPPAAVVIESLPNPPMRVHGDASLAIVVSEFPAPPLAMTPIARSVLDWVKRKQLGLVVVVEGILRRQPTEGEASEEQEPVPEAVIGIPATAFSKSILQRAGIPVLDQGLVGGIPAALLTVAATANIPLVVLFVTANKADYPDHGAAAHILEALSHLLPSLHLDPQPLFDQGRIIEHSLRDGMKMHEAAQTKPKSAQEPSIYG